jgi:hypothetical protein
MESARRAFCGFSAFHPSRCATRLSSWSAVVAGELLSREGVPPATFRDWRYLALAAGGGLLAFALSQRLNRLETPMNVVDRGRAERVRGDRGE